MRNSIPGYIEVFVDAPLAICEARDVKGLYRRSRAGESSGMTGIDDPYDRPLTPDIECHTDIETPHESARKVIAAIPLIKRPYAASTPDGPNQQSSLSRR